MLARWGMFWTVDVPATPFLDSLVFQVTYGGGYTFLDRCGQTMVDIEKARPDWLHAGANPMSGVMANETLRTNLVFNWERFELHVMRFKDENLDAICGDANKLWEIARDNLDLNEFVRIACRFHWLRAKQSLTQAEEAVPKAQLKITFPDAWKTSGFVPGARQPVIVMKREGMEYRVALQAVLRQEGISPTVLVSADPRMLPKGRQKAQLDAIKNRRSYNADPMYAVDLDVDCVAYAPTKVAPGAYIAEQYKAVREHFVPLLKDL